jgi:DNA primase
MTFPVNRYGVTPYCQTRSLFSEEKKNDLPASDATLLIDKAIEKQNTAAAETTHTPQQVPALDTTHPYKIKYIADTAIYYIQGGIPQAADHMKVMLVIEGKETSHKARNRVDLYEDKQVERLCKEVAEKLGLRKDLLEADI